MFCVSVSIWCLITHGFECFDFVNPFFKNQMQSDKSKSFYVQHKTGQIEVTSKQRFGSCAAYDFNSLIFKESDGEEGPIALTVGDSFNNSDNIINDVDEWLTENNDRVSHIDFYTVNESELEVENGERFSEVLSSSEIEGYCVVDNFGQLHTVNLVTRNDFQPVTEIINSEDLNNDSLNFLPHQQQIIDVHTIDEECVPSPVNNFPNKPKQSESLIEERVIYNDHFTSNVDKISELEYKPLRISKDFELINLNKSISVLSKSISSRPRPNYNKQKLTTLPVVKLPKKYILSGKIISQNMLPLLQTRNQMFVAHKPNILKKSVSVLCNNQTFHKGKSVLKHNGSNQVNLREREQCNSQQSNEQFKSPNSLISRPKSSNQLETSEVGNSQNYKTNTMTTKKSCVPLAVVAISTNKTDDTTEIVIKTDKGEELYKGKTSEMMKATKNNYFRSNLLVDKSYDSANKIGNNVIDEDDHITQALKSIGVDKNSYEQVESSTGQVMGYVCPVEGCKTLFDKVRIMNIHILSHYNIRPFKCDYNGCTWSFYSNFRLKRHKETHLKIKHFKCTYKSCERTFTTIYNLNTHLKLHERPAVLKCTVDGCEETFQTKRTLELHLKSHGKLHAPYICKIDGCGKCYYSANSLHSHSRTHKHSIEELRCEYCYKMFDKPCRLKTHLRVHTGVKPYKCTFEGCDWAFMTSSKLRRHEHKHTQLRKFTCNLCFKSFLRGEHLKDHSMKHFVCKSFVCPIQGCGLNFKNRSSVYAHLKKRHHTKADSPVKPAVYDSWPVTLVPTEQCNLAKDTHVTGSPDSNSLDSIEMLTEDNLISTMESLQYNNDVDVIRSSSGGSSGLCFNGMSTEGLLVGLPELINNYAPQLDQDYTTGIPNPTLVTHIVVAESKDSESLDIGSHSFETNSDPMSLSNGCIGSARTGLTYQETLQDRERRKTKDIRKPQSVRKRLVSLSTSDKAKVTLCLDSPSKEHLGLRVASDVVLSAGLLGGSQDNLTRSLLLQDELSSGDLYGGSQVQEETSLLGSSVELLCEDTAPRHSDFEQSTINLRDLE